MNKRQLTGNSALYYAAFQLSRHGWHVMPTTRNARGADLIISNSNQSVLIPIQSKGLNGGAPNIRDIDLDSIGNTWWVITVDCNSKSPTSYILSPDEVRNGVVQSFGVKPAWNLIAYMAKHPGKGYRNEGNREAWHKFGQPD